jgi:ribosomal protein L12E/L44/L45/RPP1/RPP2
MLRRYQSYAETQAALGRLYAALGVDPPPAQIEELDLASVDRDIRHAMAEYKAHPPAAPAGDAAQPSTTPAQQETPPPQASNPFDIFHTAVASSRIDEPAAPPQTSVATPTAGSQSADAATSGSLGGIRPN